MSYVDWIREAAQRAYDRAIDRHPVSPPDPAEIQSVLMSQWVLLESLARANHYDVLECSSQLRDVCNLVCSWLYHVGGASVQADVDHLRIKDAEYGGSWKKRGGSGAFHAAARKWDRLESTIQTYGSLDKALWRDTRAEGVLDDVGDLRRYLILWESWRLDRERYLALKDLERRVNDPRHDATEGDGSVQTGARCSGEFDDGIADGNLTKCSASAGCGHQGCPSARDRVARVSSEGPDPATTILADRERLGKCWKCGEPLIVGARCANVRAVGLMAQRVVCEGWGR